MDSVLIIEDSRAMQRTLQRLFESDSLEVQIASMVLRVGNFPEAAAKRGGA